MSLSLSIFLCSHQEMVILNIIEINTEYVEVSQIQTHAKN